jgi:hypothetical protein
MVGVKLSVQVGSGVDVKKVVGIFEGRNDGSTLGRKVGIDVGTTDGI